MAVIFSDHDERVWRMLCRCCRVHAPHTDSAIPQSGSRAHGRAVFSIGQLYCMDCSDSLWMHYLSTRTIT